MVFLKRLLNRLYNRYFYKKKGTNKTFFKYTVACQDILGYFVLRYLIKKLKTSSLTSKESLLIKGLNPKKVALPEVKEVEKIETFKDKLHPASVPLLIFAGIVIFNTDIIKGLNYLYNTSIVSWFFSEINFKFLNDLKKTTEITGQPFEAPVLKKLDVLEKVADKMSVAEENAQIGIRQLLNYIKQSKAVDAYAGIVSFTKEYYEYLKVKGNIRKLAQIEKDVISQGDLIEDPKLINKITEAFKPLDTHNAVESLKHISSLENKVVNQIPKKIITSKRLIPKLVKKVKKVKEVFVPGITKRTSYLLMAVYGFIFNKKIIDTSLLENTSKNKQILPNLSIKSASDSLSKIKVLHLRGGPNLTSERKTIWWKPGMFSQKINFLKHFFPR